MAYDFVYTLSGTESTSYVPITTYQIGSPEEDIVGADEYFEYHLDYETWNSLTDREKKTALIAATRRLNAEPYGGQKTTTTQKLEFPRKCLPTRKYSTDPYHHLYASQKHLVSGCSDTAYFQRSDILPVEIVEATFELAVYLVKEFNEDPTVSRQDQERLKSLSVGPLKLDMYRVSESVLPSPVITLLKASGPATWLGNQPTSIVRG